MEAGLAGAPAQERACQEGAGHRRAAVGGPDQGLEQRREPGGRSQNDSGCHCTPTTKRRVAASRCPSTTPSGLRAERTRPSPSALDRLVVEAVHGDSSPSQDLAKARPGQDRAPRGSVSQRSPIGIVRTPPLVLETGCPGPVFRPWQRLTPDGPGRWRGGAGPGAGPRGTSASSKASRSGNAGHRSVPGLAVVRGIHVGAAGQDEPVDAVEDAPGASSGRAGGEDQGQPARRLHRRARSPPAGGRSPAPAGSSRW